VPFSPPSIGANEIAEIIATLESGWLSTGPRVRSFEAEFADFIGAPAAIAVNSCTSALHLSLVAAGVGPGDEVITTPLTFVSTANVIVHAGATPVFADVDPETGNLDPHAAAAAVTPRTRAIIPVHYGGRPADVDAFAELARRHGLIVIEDAAHCVEGIAGGRKIGTTGDFTCFSFYATKNLTTGEGGMVTTASPAAAEQIRLASLHGMTRNGWSRYERPGTVHYDVVLAGYKYNMSDMQAAIGLHQLAALPRHFARRVRISNRYDDGLADLPLDAFVPLPDRDVHARHLYTVLVDPDRAGLTRDDLARRLAADGIATSLHFPPVHLHTFYRQRFGTARGQFPHTERIADRILSLPLSPALTDAQVDQVIHAVTRAVCG
jgi:dTDP-4-amino-4,6-dideoxygalactose transaminase